MKYLLDEDGRKALEAFCMTEALFAFDYDGTLAPIVEDPVQAPMRPSTSKLLEDLTQLAPVAVISGRSRMDVARFLTGNVDFIIGNHGLEGIPGGSKSLETAEASCKRWVRDLSEDFQMEGVTIEDKKFSLALHYRRSQDKRAARNHILEVAANLTPSPRIVLGKCVVNLISPGAPHKGVALLETMLSSGCRSAIYFGDDDNDEDVFRLGEESLLTIRIGECEDSNALFYIKSQEEIDEVLRLSCEALTKSGRLPRIEKLIGGEDRHAPRQ